MEKKILRYVDTKVMYGSNSVSIMSLFDDTDGKLYTSKVELDTADKDKIIEQLGAHYNCEIMKERGCMVK